MKVYGFEIYKNQNQSITLEQDGDIVILDVIVIDAVCAELQKLKKEIIEGE